MLSGGYAARIDTLDRHGAEERWSSVVDLAGRLSAFGLCVAEFVHVKRVRHPRTRQDRDRISRASDGDPGHARHPTTGGW